VRGVRLICVPEERLQFVRLVPAPYGIELQMPKAKARDICHEDYHQGAAVVFNILPFSRLNDQYIASFRVEREGDALAAYSTQPCCLVDIAIEAFRTIFEMYGSSLMVHVV